MKKISDFIKQKANLRNVIIFLSLGFSLQFFLMGIILPKLKAFTGGLAPFDLQMNLTIEYAKKFLQNAGDRGRSFYLIQFLGIDWIFSLISGVAYTLLLTLLIKKSFQNENVMMKFHLIPLFITFFDYLENTFFVIITSSFPAINSSLIQLAKTFSIVKNILVGISFLLIIIHTIILIINKINKYRKRINNGY